MMVAGCIDSGASVMIQDNKWSYTGGVLATASKDKKIRLCDPRSGSVSAEVQAHENSKTPVERSSNALQRSLNATAACHTHSYEL